MIFKAFTSFLCIFVHTINDCDAASCGQGRAVKLWMVKSFIEYYLNLDQGNKDQVKSGEFWYNIYKAVGYKVQSKTGANFDVPLRQFNGQIDDWLKEGFISADDAKQEKLSLQSDQSQTVVKEFVFKRGQVDMVYGINGFIKLSEQTGASAFTFHTFRFNAFASGRRRRKRYIPPQVWENLSQVAKFKNIDWGATIGTAISSFIAKQLDDVMVYIRYRALKNLYDEQGAMLKNLLKEEEACRDSLPASARKVNQRIATYSHLPVQQIFTYYPFTRPPNCCK